jgi:hypothetical protein
MSNHRCIATAISVTGGALLAAALVAFATQARYAANSHVFPHIMETLGLTP